MALKHACRSIRTSEPHKIMIGFRSTAVTQTPVSLKTPCGRMNPTLACGDEFIDLPFWVRFVVVCDPLFDYGISSFRKKGINLKVILYASLFLSVPIWQQHYSTSFAGYFIIIFMKHLHILFYPHEECIYLGLFFCHLFVLGFVSIALSAEINCGFLALR